LFKIKKEIGFFKEGGMGTPPSSSSEKNSMMEAE
jgi:hypothetical protein